MSWGAAGSLWYLVGVCALWGCQRPDAEPRRSVPTLAIQPPTDTARLDSACQAADTLPPAGLRSVFAEESLMLRTSPGVQRVGRALSITGSRRVVVLRDCYEEGDRFESYRYQRFIPRLKAHLIDVVFYEAGATLLIGASGARYAVLSDPVLSPDSLHFLTWLDGDDPYDSHAAVEVWDVAGDSLVRVFELSGDGSWVMRHVRWRNDSTISLWRGMTRDGIETGDSIPLHIRRRGGEWDTTSTVP